jgi:hypothetical protein
MRAFSKLFFEIKGDASSDWLTILGERPEGSPGLRHVWFVLTRKELEKLIAGEIDTTSDGYHTVLVYGDRWTFYDFELPLNKAGSFECKYLAVDLPRVFMRAVQRLARKTWGLMKAARDADPRGEHTYDRPTSVRLDMTPAHVERALRLYGQGHGEVIFDFGDYKPEETAAFMRECRAHGGSTFSDSLFRVQTIARNSTWSVFQRATVRMSKDWDGFYWEARTPRGRRIMNGGIVNHGARDGGHNWSVHT